MATSYGAPTVSTKGLILAIDAGDSNCMSPGDTSCTNMVTGGQLTGASGTPGSGAHTADTANFPAYNSLYGGIFDFDGGRGMNCDENLGTTTTSTICMWLWRNTTANTQYFADGRNNGGDWFLSNYGSENINWEGRLKYKFNGAAATYDQTAFPTNQWLHMVAVSGPGGSTLYLDGETPPEALVNDGSADEDFGTNYRIGTRYTTSAEWTGYMGPIFFYNRELSADEAKQNFEVHRSRFGV